MKNNQESKSFWKGKGFYLALTLVIAGAATASFLAINSMMDKLGAAPAPQIQVRIGWDKVSGATGYYVYVYDPASGSYKRQSLTSTNEYR